MADLSAEEVERFGADYAAGVRHVKDLATELRISFKTAYALVRKLNLPLRRETARRERIADAIGPAGLPSSGEAGGPDMQAVAKALERRLVEHLLDLQMKAASATGVRAASLARAIADGSRALKSIRDWVGQLANEDGSADDESAPRSLEELRDELRRHLERIRSEERGSPELHGDADAP